MGVARIQMTPVANFEIGRDQDTVYAINDKRQRWRQFDFEKLAQGETWVTRDALAKIGVNNPPLVAGLLTTLSEDGPTSILVGAYCDRSLAAVIPVAIPPVAVPTIVAVPMVITVPPVVTVATVTVSCRHDDTTAQQGAQERKDKNAFHTNIHFGLLLSAHALRGVGGA
jgi:hypothetical protein